MNAAFERGLWLLVGAMLVAAVAAHFLADEALARAAHANRLVESQILQWTTELGEAGWWLIPAGVVFAVAAVRKQHNLARWAFAVIAAVGGSGIVVNLLKMAIGKTRPKLLFEEGRLEFVPFTYGHAFNGFPSGHATTCAAAATVLALAFPRWRAAFLVGGFALALTRVAIHAHYLSDVCAGFALGTACALLTFRVWRARWPESVPR
jgi:membrane-associated phospholipid phosphatase